MRSGESDGSGVRTGCNKGKLVAGCAAAIHLLLLSTRLTYGPTFTVGPVSLVPGVETQEKIADLTFNASRGQGPGNAQSL